MGTAMFAISLELLRSLKATPGKKLEVVSNDIPADATFTGTFLDHVMDRMWLKVESSELPETPYGSNCPVIQGPVLRVIEEKETSKVKFREFI